MAKQETLTKLGEIFSDVLDREGVEVTPEMTAADVEGWDSVAHIRILIAVEQAFGVMFETDEINSLESVGDLAGLVEKKTGAA